MSIKLNFSSYLLYLFKPARFVSLFFFEKKGKVQCLSFNRRAMAHPNLLVYLGYVCNIFVLPASLSLVLLVTQVTSCKYTRHINRMCVW
jgi:hypothetical protein